MFLREMPSHSANICYLEDWGDKHIFLSNYGDYHGNYYRLELSSNAVLEFVEQRDIQSSHSDYAETWVHVKQGECDGWIRRNECRLVKPVSITEAELYKPNATYAFSYVRPYKDGLIECYGGEYEGGFHPVSLCKLYDNYIEIIKTADFDLLACYDKYGTHLPTYEELVGRGDLKIDWDNVDDSKVHARRYFCYDLSETKIVFYPVTMFWWN